MMQDSVVSNSGTVCQRDVCGRRFYVDFWVVALVY